MQTVQRTASWRKRPRVESIEALVDLAHDRSRAGRENLASAVGDLFGANNGTLSEGEQIIMHDILGKLVKDVEISVRSMLARKLADFDDAPHDLIVELANDDCVVALPVLQRSSVLHDSELIEIIQHRTMEHRLAISMRREVSELVSGALIETEEAGVVETLLRNQGSNLSSKSLSHLVDQSETIENYQEPLLDRRELTPDMAKKMYWWVSAALRENILNRYALDPDDFDDAMQDAVRDALHESGHAAAPPPESLAALMQFDEVSQHRLVKVLRDGEVATFQRMMCDTIDLPLPEVRRIMFERGGENLAIACRAAELAPNVFAAIYRLVRSATDGDQPLPRGELTRIASLYLDIDPAHAKAVLRQWRRNPDYLAAIEQVKSGGAGK